MVLYVEIEVRDEAAGFKRDGHFGPFYPSGKQAYNPVSRYEARFEIHPKLGAGRSRTASNGMASTSSSIN